MKINEIELIPTQSFSKKIVSTWLKKSTPKGTLENFIINYVEYGDQRGIILTDEHNNIAAYAGFVSCLNGKVWLAKNVNSYAPFKGQKLGAKIYQMVKTEFKVSIQSDMYQSLSAKKLWMATLPSLGLNPMIFDTETNRIIDPKKSNISVYSLASPRRYCWILEKNDHYPSQNLLNENSLIQPYKGLWVSKFN